MGAPETPLLTDGNGTRVRARDQRQVDTGYVDEQRHGDTDDAHPKPPIAVRTFPIGTMNMRFMMVPVLNFIHCYPVFLVHFVARTTDGDSTTAAQEKAQSAHFYPVKVCHRANSHRWSSLLTRGQPKRILMRDDGCSELAGKHRSNDSS